MASTVRPILEFELHTCTVLHFRLVSDSKTRCFKQGYCTFTQQLLLDWEYNFKHYNFSKQTTMFVREKHLWKKKHPGVDRACGFPVKAFVVRVIGHTWKTDHIVPWQVLINLKQRPITVPFSESEKRDYFVKLGKTPDCCEILTAQFNGLHCVASSVKIRRKTYFLPCTTRHTGVSWYSFHSVNHTWKSYERFRIIYLHTDAVFEVCLLPDLRLFSKCLRWKTHLSPAPVMVHMLSHIQKSCKEYLRLWTMTFGIVTKSKTSTSFLTLIFIYISYFVYIYVLYFYFY